MIRFKGGVNEIQHIQHSLIEIAEEQSIDKVWSEVISWVKKAETRGKAREVLVACSMFDPKVFKMIGTGSEKCGRYVYQDLW